MRYLLYGFLGFLLSGCLTMGGGYPGTLQEQVKYHSDLLRDANRNQDCKQVVSNLQGLLARTSDSETIRQAIAPDSFATLCYKTYLKQQIDALNIPEQILSINSKLVAIFESKVISEIEYKALQNELSQKVVSGSLTDKLPIYLGDPYEDVVPALKAATNQKKIVDRTVSSLQDKGNQERRISALMKYVIQVGVSSVEGRRIESLLPSFNITNNELDPVSKAFPKYAEQRRAVVSLNVGLQLKNADRLVLADLVSSLKKRVKGVNWNTSPSPKGLLVVVDQVRYNEKSLPEQKQTVTYARHEVHTAMAVMLMPQESSYVYEAVTSASSVDYGYVISVYQDGTLLREDIVRGKEESKELRCLNPRVQNVFGGVNPANFMANEEMKARCSNNQKLSTFDEMREAVFKKVSDSILTIPAIKSVHESN